MSFYQGIELAMNAGIDLSIGDYVYEFDSTLISYPENLITEIYYRCLQGYDIVSACPKASGHRMSGMFYRIYNHFSGSKYQLRTEAFRILSRRAINRAHAITQTLPYRKAVYANCGLPADSVYYDRTTVIPTAEKEELSMQREVALDALMLYTNVAYKFSLAFSILMIVLLLFSVVYIIAVYCTGNPVAGWTTTMLVLSGGFLGISILLTMVIKYLSIILKMIFTKQKYVIKGVEKL